VAFSATLDTGPKHPVKRRFGDQQPLADPDCRDFAPLGGGIRLVATNPELLAGFFDRVRQPLGGSQHVKIKLFLLIMSFTSLLILDKPFLVIHR